MLYTNEKEISKDLVENATALQQDYVGMVKIMTRKEFGEFISLDVPIQHIKNDGQERVRMTAALLQKDQIEHIFGMLKILEMNPSNVHITEAIRDEILNK